MRDVVGNRFHFSTDIAVVIQAPGYVVLQRQIYCSGSCMLGHLCIYIMGSSHRWSVIGLYMHRSYSLVRLVVRVLLNLRSYQDGYLFVTVCHHGAFTVLSPLED